MKTICQYRNNKVAIFRGRHVPHAKHSYALLPGKFDYRIERQTDAGQSDPYVPLCFEGDTKSMIKVNQHDETKVSLLSKCILTD